MPNHDCEYREKIIEMHTDIRWMRTDAERRNGILDEHIKDSDDYRKRIDRNTVWRHGLKLCILGMCGVLWYLIQEHMK